ncbi:purple acid phosphatase family protein [Entomospira culicis]|uniref:Metallophosphoesterase family protein n=1 Tax=Entomospira culicis TaxID=2719989 RepID=A0A968KWL9_9SPIO|nr:metallophosphoesterase family protein [Entomospira culicis]NIZ19168.1 metallophosphoesterase family protein [Entomospira culicis]NIZ69382.1 metallophosphoesterase family protein [Entomospira culicis]WDI36499.1 metallophosphoesterase family protein [Entomospira culicis]WDI38125.1 metallophosphoesterase family protein [Entomospira culicis]
MRWMRMLGSLLLVLSVVSCSKSTSKSYLATVDIFGASDATKLERLDGEALIYDVDRSDPHFYRFLVTASGDKQTLRVVDEQITSIGAFKEAKTFVITPQYHHVYLQKAMPATHYLYPNAETGTLAFVAVKATGTGINFFYSNEIDDVEIPFGNAIADVPLGALLTPDGVSGEGMYEIHLRSNDPAWGEVSFAARHDMGDGFYNEGRSHTWATMFMEDSDLAGDTAVRSPKLARYSMPAMPAPVDLGDGAYLYTVDLFNYNEDNLPMLYDASKKKRAPLVVQRSINRTNGNYRMQLRSDNPALSLVMYEGKSPAQVGAFGDGSFVLTPDYAHVYFVGAIANDFISSTINPINPRITYYMSATDDGRVKLSAIKDNPLPITLFYTSPSTQVDFAITEDNGIASEMGLMQASALLPKGASAKGKHLVSITTHAIIAPASDIYFKARTEINERDSDPTTLFGIEAHDDITVALKHASFYMPPYGKAMVDRSTLWHYTPAIREHEGQVGHGAFGSAKQGNARLWQSVQTTFNGEYTRHLLRYDFSLNDAERYQSAYVDLHHRGAIRIYLNGVDLTEYQNTVQHGVSRPFNEMSQTTRFINLPSDLLKNGENSLTLELQALPNDDILYLDVKNFTLFNVPYALEPTVMLNLNIHLGVDASQRGFAWSSSSPSAGVLTYWQEGQAPMSVPATRKPMERLHGFFTNHVTLTNLETGATYYYQIAHDNGKSEALVSDIYSFKTDAMLDSFAFVSVTDAQLGKNGMVEPVAIAWHRTLDHILTKWPEASFLLSSGDQIEHPDHQNQYNLFFTHPLMTKIPISVTSGSHDKHAIYLEHFNLPGTLTPIGGSPTGGNYAFTYGKVLFMSLDTTDRTPADTSKHIQFMQDSIEKYKRENNGEEPLWKILNFHYLPYATTRYAIHPVLRALRADLSPALSVLDIDVVFNGHDHAYGRTLMLEGGYNANGGTLEDGTVGAKPIWEGYIANGKNLFAEFTKRRGQFFHHTGNAASLGFNPLYPTDYPYHAYTEQNNRPSVTLVEVTPDAITLRAYYSDVPISEASMFDSFILRKAR